MERGDINQEHLTVSVLERKYWYLVPFTEYEPVGLRERTHKLRIDLFVLRTSNNFDLVDYNYGVYQVLKNDDSRDHDVFKDREET